MAVTPTWQAATSGQPALAGHANQFLGTHAATLLYAGTQTAAQATTGSSQNASSAGWTAQSFTTAGGQTAIGYIMLNTSVIGTTSGANLSPVTISIYANSGGAPTGSALVSVSASAEYVSYFNNSFAFYPVPVTGLTASTTYWIVMPVIGNSTFHYDWFRSNQSSGASTSPNGTTWTAQSYGLLYKVFDQTTSGLLQGTWEDSGARWTGITYSANGSISKYCEYTAGQTTAGYLQSTRTFSYTSGLLTGVA